jgi:Xaa-Pro aminopeptidase
MKFSPPGANMNTQASTLDTVPARLQRVRQVMLAEGVQALLVPSSDPHLSEYLPAYWQGRQWLSGFTGSVASLVVTADFAGLWVDSRYWEQAEKELVDSGITLMKIRPGVAGPLDWLAEQAAPGDVVAVDGAVMALASARTLRDKLHAREASLRTQDDLLGKVWTEREELPLQPVIVHAPPFASQDRGERLAALRQSMVERGASWHFLATLDDIAWLFNLRGSDVSYNPVFLGFALISLDTSTLFVDSRKVESDVREALLRDGVELREYDEVSTALAAIAADASLLIDPARVTCGLIEHVGGVRLVEGINPTTLAKSRKSAQDIAFIRQAMEQDGAALCEFFAWFESAWGQQPISEMDVDRRLTAARARRTGFVSPSFATIAAFNANGAMPHYRATDESHAVISGDGLLLIDSGGQYLGGTTDITRMVPIGQPSIEQRHDCTRVFKGMAALSRARFPKGIQAPLLDAIARAPLWADAVDYGHGTGHGVGYFLNVHEGPQVIAYQAASTAQTAMQPGMVTSIEPGTYRPGQWGVRIENLVVNQPVASGSFGEFLEFETLTLCPIDTRCLEMDQLMQEDRDWLNTYHAQVRRSLSPLLVGSALAWLEERTLPV